MKKQNVAPKKVKKANAVRATAARYASITHAFDRVSTSLKSTFWSWFWQATPAWARISDAGSQSWGWALSWKKKWR